MMIQDIEGFDATYKEIKPKKEDYLLVYKGNYILLKDNKNYTFLCKSLKGYFPYLLHKIN